MKKWTILLLALLCSTAGAAAQDFSVVNPRCEYRDEPLGINTLTHRFPRPPRARAPPAVKIRYCFFIC